MTEEELNTLTQILGNMKAPTSDLGKLPNEDPFASPQVNPMMEPIKTQGLPIPTTDLERARFGLSNPEQEKRLNQMSSRAGLEGRALDRIQNSGINDPLQGQVRNPSEFGPTNEGGTITALSPFDVPGGVPEVGYAPVPPGQEPFIAYDKVVPQTPFGGNSELLIDSIPTGILPSQDPGAGPIPTSMPMKPRPGPSSSSEGDSGGFVNSSGVDSSFYMPGPAELAGLTKEEKEREEFKRAAELRAERQFYYDAKRAEDEAVYGGPPMSPEIMKIDNAVKSPFRFLKAMGEVPVDAFGNLVQHIYGDGGIDADGKVTGTGRYANNSFPDLIAQGAIPLLERTGSFMDWLTGQGGTGLGEELPSAPNLEALNNRTGGEGNINLENGTGGPATFEPEKQEMPAYMPNDLNLIGFNPKYEDQKLSDFMNYNDNPNTPTEQFLDPQGRLRRRYVGNKELTPQYASYEREARLQRQRLGARPDFNTPVSDKGRRAQELLGSMPAKEVFNPRTVNGFFESEPGKFVQIEQGGSPSPYGGVSGSEMQNVNQIVMGMGLNLNNLYYKDGELYQKDVGKDTLLTPQQVAQIRATAGGEALYNQMIKNSDIRVLPE